MAVLSYPTLPSGRVPQVWTPELEQLDIGHQSPFTGSIQTIELPGARWYVTVGYNRLDDRDARVMQAFLVQLRGRVNKVNMPWLGPRRRMGAIAGNPVVNGAGQTGASIDVRAMPASTIVLRRGDIISLGSPIRAWRMVTADVVSDASGLATITFEPPVISTTIGDGHPVYYSRTACVAQMEMAEPKAGWTDLPGGFVDVTLSLRSSL